MSASKLGWPMRKSERAAMSKPHLGKVIHSIFVDRRYEGPREHHGLGFLLVGGVSAAGSSVKGVESELWAQRVSREGREY